MNDAFVWIQLNNDFIMVFDAKDVVLILCVCARCAFFEADIKRRINVNSNGSATKLLVTTLKTDSNALSMKWTQKHINLHLLLIQ